MSTKRQKIESFRKRLQEQNADSNYTNQFLYDVLMGHGKWLIKREISSGRIYRNNSLFQVYACQDVIPVPAIDPCCTIKTNCVLYRTKNPLPEAWIDNDGPVIKSITSVDGSTDFFVVSPGDWQNKKNDPYQKMSKQKYAFILNNYAFFPVHNPHKVNITGYFTDDLDMLEDSCADCQDAKKDCIRFLDTKFMIPDWLEEEMFSKALQGLLPSKQMIEDAQIDKNPNRKN